MHKGAAFVWEATAEAAQQRLDRTLAILREENLEADGELGNYRPLRALRRRSRRSTRTGWSSARFPRTSRRGSGTTSWTAPARHTACR